MSNSGKLRVLIADDESHIRALMKRTMMKLDLEIAGEARDGEEAVELFRKEKPDLLLLDINMPRKTGIEALEEIRGSFPQSCVIMLTSIADFDSVSKCIQLGAANYIRKDSSLEEIGGAVKKICGKIEKKKESKEKSEEKP